MAKQLQLRRGTTVRHNTFTGAVGEVTIDTDKDVVVVHDGATAGGFPGQKELVSGTNIKTVNSTTLLGSGDIAVQPTLVSGTNIKTINNSTILGSGNINVVSAGMITGGTTNQVLAKNSSTDYATKWYSVQEPLVSGTNIKTVNSTSLLGSGDVAVQPTLVSGTNIKTINSTSLLGSGDVAVQPTLVSGTNIKTINGSSLLGSGNIDPVGFTPVQQGGGDGQGPSKVFVGWSGSGISLQVDYTNFGTTWPMNITGSAGAVLGVGQSWQAVTRAAGVTYNNGTGKAIQVAISVNTSASFQMDFIVNGVTFRTPGHSGDGMYFFIIPAGVNYAVAANSVVRSWWELR